MHSQTFRRDTQVKAFKERFPRRTPSPRSGCMRRPKGEGKKAKESPRDYLRCRGGATQKDPTSNGPNDCHRNPKKAGVGGAPPLLGVAVGADTVFALSSSFRLNISNAGSFALVCVGYDKMTSGVAFACRSILCHAASQRAQKAEKPSGSFQLASCRGSTRWHPGREGR